MCHLAYLGNYDFFVPLERAKAHSKLKNPFDSIWIINIKKVFFRWTI